MSVTIGVISDAHGDLPALKAALEGLTALGVSEIIHLGDAVDIGPDSAACIDLLQANRCVCLLGNHDFGYLHGHDEHLPMSHVSGAHKKYVFASLGEEYKGVVARFPTIVLRQYYGVKIAFTHYALLNEPTASGYLWQQIETVPTAEKFDEMFANINADAVFFGHKHEPCDVIGRKLYVDVGSLGCHKGDFARAVTITVSDDGKLTYTRLQFPYDRQAFKRHMTGGDLPDSQYLFDFYFDLAYPSQK